MKKRLLSIVFALLIPCLVLMQGCTQKKVYTKSKDGDETATLTFPHFIEIGEVDGEDLENPFSRYIYDGERKVVLPAGKHTVEMRYNDVWEIGEDEHEKTISVYMILQFQAEPGRSYKIDVDEPEDLESARELASNFNPEIIDARTGEVVSR